MCNSKLLLMTRKSVITFRAEIASFPYFLMARRLAGSTLFPYTTLFRSVIDPAPVTPITVCRAIASARVRVRSEEHTSELQSRENLVCRLLLEKKMQQLNICIMMMSIVYQYSLV